MRFAHLHAAERPLAVVEGDRIAALATDGIATVDDLIAAGPDAWDTAREAAAAALDNADRLRPGMLGAPLRAPSKIACVGLNYHDHCRETGMVAPDRPLPLARLHARAGRPDPDRHPVGRGRLPRPADLPEARRRRRGRG
jgi:2-keto-4-pentenoate hydratase/2-oxohepta-3-ene-1,7-dioic acid hydratase in catechol pathway